MSQNSKEKKMKKKLVSKRGVISIITFIIIILLCSFLFFETKSQISFLKDKIYSLSTKNIVDNKDQDNSPEEIQKQPEHYDHTTENTSEDVQLTNDHKCHTHTELLINLFEIQKKILQSESFNSELLLLEIHYSSDSVIKSLLKNIRIHSESGIANIYNLHSEFKSIENDLILAYWIDNHKKNWKFYAKKILSKLVFIKKTGERAIQAGGIEMIIENVNQALESRDLDAAIGYLSQVEGKVPKKMISIWLEHAHNHIDVNNSLKKLIDYVITQQHCSHNIKNSESN